MKTVSAIKSLPSKIQKQILMKKKRKPGSGGARRNSGRKPVEDKKLQVNLYIRKSIVEKLGGMERAQLMATDYLTSNFVGAITAFKSSSTDSKI